jgi:hypothetical protein
MVDDLYVIASLPAGRQGTKQSHIIQSKEAKFAIATLSLAMTIIIILVE